MTNYRRKRPKKTTNTKTHILNEKINYDNMRIIDDSGEMVGVFSKLEALKMAEEQELDLILINPKADPVIVKMMDYSKFKYIESKQDSTKKKPTEDKIIRVSVRVSPHDLQVRAKKIDEFLEKGIKVKMQVIMKGREKQHPEVAKETMLLFISMISQEFLYESEPSLIGDSYFTSIKPKD